MLVGDLVLGSVTGTYYSLFQKLIRRMPTVTPSLFNQNIESQYVGYKIQKCNKKNVHDWSPASTVQKAVLLRRHQRQRHPSRQHLMF